MSFQQLEPSLIDCVTLANGEKTTKELLLPTVVGEDQNWLKNEVISREILKNKNK